jgi:carbon storage regulator
MLIFTRRVNETICIGEDVTVTVVRINGSTATLGVLAPREVRVHREEIFRRVREEEKG